MPTSTFAKSANYNDLSPAITLASPHAAGASTLVLSAGAGARLGTLAANRIFRVTALTNPDLPSESVLGIFEAAGISADTLTGVTAVEGFTNVALSAGVTIQVRETAKSYEDHSAAINALESLTATTYNVKAYGAKGDGTTDDTTAIANAWAASGSAGPLYFPPGNFLYNGPGLSCVNNGNMALVGAGKGLSTISLGATSRLIDVGTNFLGDLEVTHLQTYGGLGLFRSTRTAQNSGVGSAAVQHCLLQGYTGCAIEINASDWPAWRVEGVQFFGTNSSIGFAHAGLTDGGVIRDCVFGTNRASVKVRNGGLNLAIESVQFYRDVAPGVNPRVDLWFVPNPSPTNAGHGVVVRDCKFGNELIASTDYRILYADEDVVGTTIGTRYPVLSADSTGYIVGHHYSGCNLIQGATALPLVYSTTPNVRSCQIGEGFLFQGAPSYLLQYRTAPGADFNACENVYGPIASDAAGISSPFPPLSNAVGTGYADDPAGLITTDPALPIGHGAGDPVNYQALLTTSVRSFVTTGTTVTNIADAYGGSDAIEVSCNNGVIYASFPAPGNVQLGVPAWIEFDLKSGSTGPFTSVLTRISDSGFANTHWSRVPVISAHWSRHRYCWIPRASDSSFLFLALTTSAQGTGTYQIGRVRVYQCREPVNVDGYIPGNLTVPGAITGGSVVHLTGNETVAGIKTFSDPLEAPIVKMTSPGASQWMRESPTGPGFRFSLAGDGHWYIQGTGDGFATAYTIATVGTTAAGYPVAFTTPVACAAGVSGNGSGLTSLNASNLATGTAPTARLGSGTATSSTFLRGDQTWATPAGGLVPTSKSSAYTAAANDLVLADATGGAFTVTLPAGQAAGARVGVKKRDTGGNAITVSAGGNTIKGAISGGQTTLNVRGEGDLYVFTFDGSSVWDIADRVISPSYCSVYASTAAQGFATGTEVAVTFDTAPTDADSLWSGGSPTRITAKKAGKYTITGSVIWNNIPACRNYIAIWVNGALTGTLLTEQGAPTNATYPTWGCSATCDLNHGDYVEMTASQAGGGTQHLLSVPGVNPQFQVHRTGD